jgi:hypothetical protein
MSEYESSGPCRVIDPPLRAETMTPLRDYFAGQALMAMGPEAIAALTNSVGDFEPGKVDGICASAARMAYRFADAMLEARKR